MEVINETCQIEQLHSLSATPWSNADRHQNDVSFSTNCNHLSAKFVWSFNKSKLEVFSYGLTCQSRLLSQFDFAKIYNDSSANIALVTRLVDRFEVTSKFRHPYKLIVVVNLDNRTRNYICIVDIRLSKVLSTIEFPFTITCIEVIFSGSLTGFESWPLIPELMCMDGILTVGCEGGLVFFIDLILDSTSPVPLIPKKHNILTRNNLHMDHKNKRRTVIFHNQYICIPLNSEAKTKGKFNYRDEGRILASYNASHVYVSSMHFIPQLAILCIGYNFGGFHLYNLNNFVLECSSELDPDLLPIIGFAYQMPENDPKNYSYLTVMRGIDIRTACHEQFNSCCTAVLYLLCFENKEFIPNYGLLYKTFKICQAKFEFNLAGNPCEKTISSRRYRSKLISMYTINQIVNVKFDDNVDQSSIDHNYLFISWQAEIIGEKSNLSYYFLLFDLNQWYKSQMPKRFYIVESNQCPFMSIYSLNKLGRSLSPDTIQSISIHNNSLNKYSTSPPSHYHEMHSFPSSLSFSLSVVSQTKLCNVTFQSPQKRLLSLFISKGPSILVQPEDVIYKYLQSALIAPDFINLITPGNDFNVLRKILLNLALENKLTSFLIRVVKEWATGEMASLGCDLKNFLDWCWSKVGAIKLNIDSITRTLFDFSGCPLMEQDKACLVSFESDLSILALLLREMENSSEALTQQSTDELEARKEAIELLRGYLKIILLFEELDLLPEQPQSAANENSFVYNYNKLNNFYQTRRREFIKGKENIYKNEDILLIDTIIRHLNQSNLWGVMNDEAANEANNDKLYPPMNVYSLIQIFLNESIPLIYKESILLYFLLDFSDQVSEQHYYHAQKILIFLSSLRISQGIQYFVQGLWFLDHQNYESGLQFLTHPIVSCSLADFKLDMQMFNQLMQRIVELFQFENQFKNALVFIQSCGHFLLDSENNEILYLQMLLLNDNLTAAFHFQRDRRTVDNALTMLYRLLFICEKKSMLEKVCRIPLDEYEEKVFIDYLLKSDNVENKKMLIMYFVYNNKLFEAIKLSKEFEDVINFQPEERKMIQTWTALMPSNVMGLAEEIANIVNGQNNHEEAAQTIMLTKVVDPIVTIKIKPKQKRIPLISASSFVEREIEKNEKQFNEMMANNSRTPLRARKSNSLYLSPRVSGSKVTKAKSSQNLLKSLLKELKPMEVKQALGDQMSPFATPSKPILKLSTRSPSIDSDAVSTASSQKYKVSFYFDKKKKGTKKNKVSQQQADQGEQGIEDMIDNDFNNTTNENIQQFRNDEVIALQEITKDIESNESIATDLEHNPNEPMCGDDTTTNYTDSEATTDSEMREQPIDDITGTMTPSKSRRGSRQRKSVDTPTHKMSLRSKKSAENKN